MIRRDPTMFVVGSLLLAPGSQSLNLGETRGNGLKNLGGIGDLGA